ncbi:glycosyltransferase family 2 protein [Paenarthrobacter sp. DKR-5]|uniref:glycosyltransferase family 2 protein n=1 Tax=Paenarthrobacter sp. DKR-5 TaxID=2835535 RepID=UPI001BDC6DF7|nr:glycosyltransferase family 2 protein [Paenarthrobacter sp. DKR-5]MBT1003035.1 glycosyltransferase family 2 protein [Paenarthrobacter sp. DKR-5]
MPAAKPPIRPAVDVVIAVHNAARPVRRAVESVFAAGLAPGRDGGVRVSVVCHNVPVEEIRALFPSPLAEQVRFLSCADGIPSPAGPFNTGLAAADAEYVSIMGSDDTLEPGALADWLEVARCCTSDAVIAPQRHAGGAKVRTPPVRVGRRRHLDPVKDRLSYRTAPLGLVRTAEIRRQGLAFSAGRRSGEDQEFSSKLWFGGGRIDYARGAGRYVVGADAADRITSARRPVAEDLGFATDLVAGEWFRHLPQRARTAIVTKILRVHVFGMVLARAGGDGWSAADRQALAEAAGALTAAAPGARRLLSVADNRLLQSILDPGSPEAVLVRRAHERRRFGRPATVFAAGLTAQFNPEAPLRFIAASALL